jgi:hypothetical protein
MLPRPSPREMCGKVTDALTALQSGRFQLGPLKHLSGDLEELELPSAVELPNLLIDLLGEIQQTGPIECYAGTRPPQRSYESQILGLELWAYSWHSPRFRKRMYLKFALKNQCYIHVDCHEDRPPERLL